MHQQANDNESFLLIRGTEKANNFNTETLSNLEIHDVLTSNLLNKKMMHSEVIICRSGYSSIMDLVCLQKAAVLIPTPGQTEQEYLAKELMHQNQFFSQKQDDFNLKTALMSYKSYKNFAHLDMRKNTLKEIVAELWEF